MEIAQPRRNWTFLFYLNGDNNLREHTSLDFVRLKQGGCPQDSAVVAQVYRGEERWSWKNLGQKLSELSRPELPSAFQEDWRGCKRFVLDRDGCREIEGPIEASASRPECLQEFLERGIREFPADNYALIVSTHGSGEAGLLRDGDGRQMKLIDFRDSLLEVQKNSGVRFQLLALQACLMGQPAALSVLKGCAENLLASPQEIPAGQARYDQLMDAIDSPSAQSKECVADQFRQTFQASMPGFVLHREPGSSSSTST